MSGGPYGRGKAPERACLKLQQWPAPDRELWERALAPADPFNPEQGARARHSYRSNRKTEVGYGRFLTFLAGVVDLAREPIPAGRITRERVVAYVARLQQLNATGTILARLQELGEAAAALDPSQDWSFIRRIAARVRAKHQPARDKRTALAPTNELLDLGLELMQSAAAQSTPRLQAMTFRDGLLIAFLALRPIRRKNLAALTIGDNLQRVGAGWLLTLDEDETKTHAAYEVGLPDVLVEPLEDYIRQWRPVLCGLSSRWRAEIGQALWVSSHGSPMTQMAIYDVVRKRTKEAFGRALNPHLFRDAAATTLAIADPVHVRAVSALLGHRSQQTTERHYQQAQSLSAHRLYTQALINRRRALSANHDDGDPGEVP